MTFELVLPALALRCSWLHRRLASIDRGLVLGCVGVLAFLVVWYALVKWTPIKAFNRLPDPLLVIHEWLSPNPSFGLSIFTKKYWLHILYSTYRALAAFCLALALGIPFGLMLGWSRRFHDFAFPLFSLLRPVPPLAWVPIAILMFPGVETAVIFVTFLVAFFATTMNTLVGVRSIPEDYIRAAGCLGATRTDLLWDVIVPGALPQIFTGLQIAMGAAWFSLVAGEIIAAQYGLGYAIWEAYNLVQYPTIVIGMATLGFAGYASSAALRAVGRRMMVWRQQQLGMAT